MDFQLPNLIVSGHYQVSSVVAVHNRLSIIVASKVPLLLYYYIYSPVKFPYLVLFSAYYRIHNLQKSIPLSFLSFPFTPFRPSTHYSLRSHPAMAVKHADSIWTRKIDMLYLVFFVIHIPIILGTLSASLSPLSNCCSSLCFWCRVCIPVIFGGY